MGRAGIEGVGNTGVMGVMREKGGKRWRCGGWVRVGVEPG